MNGAERTFIEEQIPAIANAVIAQTRPCVFANRIQRSDDAIPLEASKFGGCPDVPPGFVWSMTADGPCWFVGQVGLYELNRFETGFALPSDGLLSFFYHDARGPAGTESRVYLFREPALQRIAVLADQRYTTGTRAGDFPSRALEFHQGYCLPTTDDLRSLLPGVGFDDEFGDFRDAFDEQFPGGIHQFFGRPKYSDPPASLQLLASFGTVEDRYLYYISKPVNGVLDLSTVNVVYDCT